MKPNDQDKWNNLFERLDCGLKSVNEHLARPSHPVVINMQCACCAETQREILAVVREIKRLVKGSADGSTVSEVRAILEPKVDKLEGLVPSP